MSAKHVTKARAAEIVRRIFERNKDARGVAGTMALVLPGIYEDGWDNGFAAGVAAASAGRIVDDASKARADRAEADLNHLWAEMKARGWKL